MNEIHLITGMPRSGTTWIAKIIDSSPDVFYYHEPDKKGNLKIPSVVGIENFEQFEVVLENFLHNLDKTMDFDVFSKKPFEAIG